MPRVKLMVVLGSGKNAVQIDVRTSLRWQQESLSIHHLISFYCESRWSYSRNACFGRQA